MNISLSIDKKLHDRLKKEVEKLNIERESLLFQGFDVPKKKITISSFIVDSIKRDFQFEDNEMSF